MSKFYTCFGYNGHPVKDLHCTHKFLGKQPETAVSEIIKEIDEYFSYNKFVPFLVLFNKEEMFGKNKDIRVLTPKSASLSLFHLPLRESLTKYNEEDHPKYNPHVTTLLEEVDLPFDFFCLVKDGQIVKKWE